MYIKFFRLSRIIISLTFSRCLTTMYHLLLQQVATINAIESFDVVSKPVQEKDFWATAESLKASLKFSAYQLAVMCANGKTLI